MSQLNQEKERVEILSMKDLETSYYCGSGAGGQARNKVASGVQLRHEESGAMGRASDSRSQADNKKAAFQRLVADPKMKFWLAKKVFQVQQGCTIEKAVEAEMADSKLKYEIKNAEGKWEEVDANYFNLPAARGE